MKAMGLFNFFKKKQKEEISQIEPQELGVESVPEVRGECKLCEGKIYSNERYSKKGGFYFHKKCFKAIRL